MFVFFVRFKRKRFGNKLGLINKKFIEIFYYLSQEGIRIDGGDLQCQKLWGGRLIFGNIFNRKEEKQVIKLVLLFQVMWIRGG